MNVHPGGKQPKMHDTVMTNGEPQSMVDSNGVPKGLKLVLEECGVDTTHMVREDMVKVLSEFQDFREEQPAVYTYLARVMKYHGISCSSHEISWHISAQGKYIFTFHIEDNSI